MKPLQFGKLKKRFSLALLVETIFEKQHCELIMKYETVWKFGSLGLTRKCGYHICSCFSFFRRGRGEKLLWKGLSIF